MKRIVLTLTAAALAVAPVTAFGHSSSATNENIVAVAAGNPHFSTLVSLVKKAGLVGALSGKGKLTVFAPTNAAFAKVPKATLDALAKDKAKLRAVLTYHVVKGAVPASKVVTLNGRSVKTLNGASVRIRITGNAKKSVYVNNSKVVRTDIAASNGIIHVINRVLLPPTNSTPVRDGAVRGPSHRVAGRADAAIVTRHMRPWSNPESAARRRERRLTAGLRRSDPAALREIYEEHGALTFGYLVAAMGDRAAAEDVQQEVFLEVWRRGASYDPERSGLGTWIMVIARSRAIDALRKRVREPRDPAGTVAVMEQIEDPSETPDELLERWRVAGLLRRLPREQSQLLRLRFYDGLSQTEIAERTGMPLGTVKMRMVQGLNRLRDLIEQEGGR